MPEHRRIPWLKDSKRIFELRKTGKSVSSPVAVLVCSPNALLYSRVAVLASRKVGGAVQRNRCKRRLRARVRLYYPRIKPGSDILIISRPALLNAEPRDVDLAIGQLLWQAGLIEQVV